MPIANDVHWLICWQSNNKLRTHNKCLFVACTQQVDTHFFLVIMSNSNGSKCRQSNNCTLKKLNAEIILIVSKRCGRCILYTFFIKRWNVSISHVIMLCYAIWPDWVPTCCSHAIKFACINLEVNNLPARCPPCFWVTRFTGHISRPVLFAVMWLWEGKEVQHSLKEPDLSARLETIGAGKK